MRPLLFILLSCFALTSCLKHEETCLNESIEGFLITSADSIRDDSVTLYRYDTATASYTRSFSKRLEKWGSDSVLADMSGFYFPERHGWRIVLSPSGSTYIIKDIAFSYYPMKQGRSLTSSCIGGVSYSVNGVAKELVTAGHVSPAFLLPVQY